MKAVQIIRDVGKIKLMNKTVFKLEMGDWSDDGHGKTKTAVFETNVSVEYLREMYFTNKEVYGDILEYYCSEYGEYTISTEDIEEIEESGIIISDKMKEDARENGEAYVDADDMIDWFIQFMKLGNPSLELNQITQPKMPTFHFYGYDEKQRHISFFGYGTFGE